MLDGRVPGSFRDPSGFVFLHGGRVLRAVDEGCFQSLEKLHSDGTLARLSQTHGLVATQIVEQEADGAALESVYSDTYRYLEHERITPITYPYEWTLSMLADAAICTLDLQLELANSGYSLKDATPFNVQFVAGKPKFIDVASIELPGRRDIWFALGQFFQLFLYPLLLCRYRGWDLSSLFLARPNGRSIEEVAHAFGWMGLLRPILLMDLSVPLLFQWLSRGNSSKRRNLLTKPAGNAAPQVLNLRRLRRKTARIAAGYRPRSGWAAYTDHRNYTHAGEDAKMALIEGFLRETSPATVVDVGCNTGEYSFVAAETGAKVVAIDSDHDAVEVLYRRLRDKPMDITPMVGDISNPSPGIGYMNTERSPLLQRIQGDCVLCLALLHHLLITANLSLAAVRDMLAVLTTRDVVLEFVPTDDEMFRTLLGLRVDLFGELTLARCRSVFTEQFTVLKEVRLPQSKRSLLFLRLTSAAWQPLATNPNEQSRPTGNDDSAG